MAIQLNHTILYARDSKASAAFLADMLGLPAPVHWGPFEVVATANGTNLDFLDTEGEIASQHYAFLVDEAEFDDIFGRIKGRNLSYWADPANRNRGRSIATTADAGSISRTRTDTCTRSSRDPTAAVVGIREPYNALTISSVIFLASPSSIMVLSR